MNNDYVVREEQIKDYTVKVVMDDQAESPREWDNFGNMICWHRNYNLGDDIGKGSCQRDRTNTRQFPSPEDFVEFEKENKLIKLCLNLYDHSGISMSVSNSYPFNDRWDSGQVGWIYVTYEQIKKEYNCKYVTKKILEKAYSLLKSEVKTYDQYLTGQVYGYVVENKEGNDIHSCWGYYDEEDCFNEGKSIAEYEIKEEIKKHTLKVKEYIKNKVPLYARLECPIHN